MGINLGLTHFYTDAEGQEQENPRFQRRSKRALGRLGRNVARKVQGSRNRAKARKKSRLGRREPRQATGSRAL